MPKPVANRIKYIAFKSDLLHFRCGDRPVLSIRDDTASQSRKSRRFREHDWMTRYFYRIGKWG